MLAPCFWIRPVQDLVNDCGAETPKRKASSTAAIKERHWPDSPTLTKPDHLARSTLAVPPFQALLEHVQTNRPPSRVAPLMQGRRSGHRTRLAFERVERVFEVENLVTLPVVAHVFDDALAVVHNRDQQGIGTRTDPATTQLTTDGVRPKLLVATVSLPARRQLAAARSRAK